MAKNSSEVTAELEASTAVAKAQSTALAAEAPIDLFADAGMGLENVDAQSVAIPFLAVLQGLSPQIETVNGAKPGLIINTVTNELCSELEIIPCGFQRKFLKWKPRAQGGGFKGEMSVVEYERAKAEGKIELVDRGEKGIVEMINGDEIRDTRVHFVMVLKDGVTYPAVISLSSTQIKISKRLIAMIGGVKIKAPNGKLYNPPSFAYSYRVTTEKASNEKGQWYVFSFRNGEAVTDPSLYNTAKKFSVQVSEGTAVAVHTDMNDVVPDGGGTADDNEF